jgi:anti-sigma factor RsiW
MMPSICSSVRESFSAYLDGAISGREMAEIATHLQSCGDCEREFAIARVLQQSLASMGAVKAPDDLGMRLRLAISHERTRTAAGMLERFGVRWDNVFRPFLVQASAGLAGAIVLIGGIMLLLGMVAAPEPVMANDEPLGAMTSPHFLYSAIQPHAIQTKRDETIVVEANVNARGQVYDFHIVSGQSDPEVRNQIVDQLLACVFQPASVFGGPVRGRVILTFSGISVRG